MLDEDEKLWEDAVAAWGVRAAARGKRHTAVREVWLARERGLWSEREVAVRTIRRW